MSIRWTPAELAAHEAKQCKHFDDEEEAAEREADLYRPIIEWCEARGYSVFHDRSRKANRPGFLDFVIALPCGKVAWVECKTGKGRLRPEQKTEIMKLNFLNHRVFVVRSFKQFCRDVGGYVDEIAQLK